MSKILVKKKNGNCYIREKSEESGENAEEVHPNKLKTWANFGEKAHGAAGKSFEEILDAVAELGGTIVKEPRSKIQVSKEEYQSLIIQGLNKGIKVDDIDKIVEVVMVKSERQIGKPTAPLEKTTIEERIEQFIKKRQ